MIHPKVVVVFIVILLSVVLQLRVESQPTINAFEGKSCPQLEEESCIPNEEVQRLKVELENERRLVQRYLQRPAILKKMKRIGNLGSTLYSVIKVRDEIYVLRYSPNSFNSIKVFEDRNEFRLLREININETDIPFDMVYSKESNCFYIRDAGENCIWRMTTGSGHRLSKWLTNVTWPNTFSLSNEGHLLLLRKDQLEINSLSANFIHSIQLPYDIKNPRHVIQTSAGYYIILHQLTDSWNGSMVISQVNSAGQLMNRFTPRNQFQVLNDPWKLFYDSDNNRLFVPDYKNHRLILFDSNSLNWIQVLLSRETEEIWQPISMFYDAIKRQLLVLQYYGLDIYELI